MKAIRVKMDEGAYLPERFHDTDAGADLRTPRAFLLPPHGAAEVDTGVHIELPTGTCARVDPKSGLNIMASIVGFGLIDQGYTGSIKVKLYNLGMRSRYFAAGDKIAQLTVSPVLYPDFEQADEIEGGARGDAGFGSTGR